MTTYQVCAAKQGRCLGSCLGVSAGGAEPKALTHLFKSLVLPIVQYKSLIAKLERVQGFAARIVLGRWPGRHRGSEGFPHPIY